MRRARQVFIGFVPTAVASILLAGVGGCGSLFNQHAQTMDAMRGVMRDTAARLGQSGNGQIAAGGQVINPGLRVSGGVEYFAVARYEGVGGQVQASMAGPLDRPVSEADAARAEAIWRDASLSAGEKARLIRELLLGRGHGAEGGADGGADVSP